MKKSNGLQWVNPGIHQLTRAFVDATLAKQLESKAKTSPVIMMVMRYAGTISGTLIIGETRRYLRKWVLLRVPENYYSTASLLVENSTAQPSTIKICLFQHCGWVTESVCLVSYSNHQPISATTGKWSLGQRPCTWRVKMKAACTTSVPGASGGAAAISSLKKM